ncbi:MAG TPA: hypothetical protein VG940_01585 [Gemmatimonadales bacterium]|nr:hypothetical protein [Gemmatimonadales bacterium]
MAGETRDWDKEMAAIDQVIAKGGYVAPSGGGAPAPAGGGGPAPAASGAPGGRRAWLGMWVRTLLVVGLAVGLNAWPWSHYCGWRVYWYVSGISVLAIAALWIMLTSWRRRSGLTHIIGFLLFGYAVWLGAVEVLPRTGYARTSKTWSCPAPAVPAPAATDQQPAANGPQPNGQTVRP